MHKFSESMGSALPDPVRSQDTASPVPIPVMENKTAPGQTGPRGMSPRTTYSRVNAGAPPTPDAGAQTQKSLSPQGLQFLPAKTAEVSMTMTQRPGLQEMVKAAMEASRSRASITAESLRQMDTQNGEVEEKTASDNSVSEHYSTEYIHKLASALEYIETTIKVADDGNVQMPGKGPGTLGVLEATSSEKNIDAGELGSAVSQNKIPTTTGEQVEQVQVGKANTGLATNDGMMHAEQPLKPIKNENASLRPSNPLPTPTTQTKQSADELVYSNLARMGFDVEKLAAGDALAKRTVMGVIKGRARQAGQAVSETAKKFPGVQDITTGRAYRAAGAHMKETGPGLFSPPGAAEGLAAKGTKKIMHGAAKATGTVGAVGAVGVAGKKLTEKDDDEKSAGVREFTAGVRELASKHLSKAQRVASKFPGVGDVSSGAKKMKLRQFAGADSLQGKELKSEGLKSIAKGTAKGVGTLGLAAGTIEGARRGYNKLTDKDKKASAPLGYIRKLAEDALNPAKIEAGPQNPPDASASGQDQPKQPSDVRSQMRMVRTNQGAIDYTKGEAKADPKSDVNQLLAQPALSRKHDPVLHKVLDNTSGAGVKIAMAQNSERVKAARALLSNLMEKHTDKKEKESALGANAATPSVSLPSFSG